MKFIADGMLGKLTRWLRLAGQNVIYIGDLRVPAERQDDVLIEQAKNEKRRLLTCDIELHRRAKKNGIKSVFIRGDNVATQLVQLSRQCGQTVRIDLKNSRCPMCNGELELTPKSHIQKKVPSAVFKTREKFWRCKSCGKIYWQGTHWKTIAEIAERYERML